MCTLPTLRGNHAVLCALAAFLALAASQARAESIDIMMTVNGTTFDLAPFITGGSSPTNYGSVDTTSLNAFISGLGSGYQFSNIGGGSNFPGDGTVGAQLSLSGEILLAAGAVPGTLSISETEGGFSLPSASPDTLTSSSTGNWLGAAAGGSHTALSSLGSSDTPPITLTAPAGGQGPTGGSSSLSPVSLTVPFTLDNAVSFAINTPGAGQASDSFGIGVKVVPVVPEPASAILMSFGLASSVIFFGLRKRHRAAHARA